MADVGNALGVHAAAKAEQVHCVAQVDPLMQRSIALLLDRLHHLLLREKVMANLGNVNQQRTHARLSKEESLLKKLVFVGQGRALLEPVSPDDAGKRTVP